MRYLCKYSSGLWWSSKDRLAPPTQWLNVASFCPSLAGLLFRETFLLGEKGYDSIACRELLVWAFPIYKTLHSFTLPLSLKSLRECCLEHLPVWKRCVLWCLYLVLYPILKLEAEMSIQTSSVFMNNGRVKKITLSLYFTKHDDVCVVSVCLSVCVCLPPFFALVDILY